jgi:hypothetical protein
MSPCRNDERNCCDSESNRNQVPSTATGSKRQRCEQSGDKRGKPDVGDSASLTPNARFGGCEL